MRLGDNNVWHSSPPAHRTQAHRPAARLRPSSYFRWLLIAVLLTLAAATWNGTGVSAQAPQQLPPELEARAQDLYKQVMCPICDGQTIDQSRSQIAADMQSVIRERLLAGESDQAILDFFVEAYGESVLAAPPKRGAALTAWLVPPAALALGGGLVFLAIRTLQRPSPRPAQGRPDAEDPPEETWDPYLRLVDQELDAGNERERPARDRTT